MVIALGIIVSVLAALLITCVLLQSGKEKSLSGAIAGGAGDNYFGKGKGRGKDKILSLVTTILSFVFVILVVVMYLLVA